MEIIKYKKPYLIELEEKKKLKDYGENLNQLCLNVVTKLLDLLGVKDGKTEHHIALVNHIIDCYKNYTLEEIKYAFDLYIKGEYTQQTSSGFITLKPNQSLNAVVFGQVMREYELRKQKELKNYRLKIQQFKNQAKPMKQEDINEIMEKAIQEGLRHFKETGIVDNANSRYDWLDSQGKFLESFSMTQQQFNDYKKKEYNTIVAKLEVEYENKKASTKEEKASFKNILQELKEPKSGKAIIECKKKLLLNYYKKIV